VAAAAALSLMAIWARALRWRYLFPPRSDPPGLMAAMMIGYMINNVLPLRAGEFARVYVVAHRWGHGFWTTLGTVVVERVLDGMTVVLMLGILVFVIPVPGFMQWGAFVMLAVNMAAVAILAGMAWRPALTHSAASRLLRRWPHVQSLVTRAFDRFARGLEGIRSASHALPLVGWTLAAWAIPALEAWMVLRAFDLSLSWVAPWVVLVFVGISVSIPAAPGFIGVFHAAAALALGIFGVARAEAVGYALILHAAQFVPVTLVGWLMLLREQVSLTEVARAKGEREEAR
jgi:glycosyltransferase 2 family protein